MKLLIFTFAGMAFGADALLTNPIGQGKKVAIQTATDVNRK